MNPQRKMVYMQKLFNSNQYRASNSSLSTLNKDNFIRVMIESINKAISANEGPVKEKHVRRLLIGSYQTESGAFFWQYLPVIRLKENQVVCWKFCHVLHKMLRDGHRQVLMSSYERRQVLLDCGNMWRHVEDGYGQLIYKYCTLLYNRINFLLRNQGFPNDLKVSNEQLDEIGENDPSVFFDLVCEIFDALDDILRLRESVMAKTETKRLNSMTTAGQCHLAPLVVCIQDSSLLYDQAVKILFKLHASLPASTLEGHRLRFVSQHKSLKDFYIDASNLQYFKTLIQIPHLSERPPNFQIASDIQQHVAPQVIMISNEGSESPDQLLVNLADDYEGENSTVGDIVDSSITSERSHPETSADCANDRERNSGSNSLVDYADGQQEHSASPTNHRDENLDSERMQEMELLVAQLRSELDLQRSQHLESNQKLKQELEEARAEVQRVKKELSNLRYQTSSAKNAYDKLLEECTRAKHDNEISQIAMKRMVKELSEYKSRERTDQDQAARHQAARQEADNREEDLLVAEMNETDKIIKEATRKIQELSEKSRKVESGIKLQVNEKISEVCTNLMMAVRNLIAQSRILQREIVNQEGEQANKEEFYKRNSAWTEGLISAASVVAMAARSLVDAADRSMSGKAKFTELAAAAHEVAAATTQLVVASRVKAKADSEKLKLLTNAAKQVNQSTSNVVEASRICAEMIEQQEVDKIDIETLSLHQTKKLEMETQVRLLELEELLNKERQKLGLLRRQHYEQEEAQIVSSSQSQPAENRT